MEVTAAANNNLGAEIASGKPVDGAPVGVTGKKSSKPKQESKQEQDQTQGLGDWKEPDVLTYGTDSRGMVGTMIYLSPEEIEEDKKLHVRMFSGAPEKENAAIAEMARQFITDGIGQSHPVHVVHRRKGLEEKWFLVDGNRRKQAMMLANTWQRQAKKPETKLKCMVIEDGRDLLRAAWIANEGQRSNSILSRALMIRRLREERGLSTIQEIAEWMGCSTATVTQAERIGRDLSHEAQIALHDGVISADDALKRLVNVKPERQAEVIQDAQEIDRKNKAKETDGPGQGQGQGQKHERGPVNETPPQNPAAEIRKSMTMPSGKEIGQIFTEKMSAAKTANAGRSILVYIDWALGEMMKSGGIEPITGQIRPNHYRSFSTVTNEDRKKVVREWLAKHPNDGRLGAMFDDATVAYKHLQDLIRAEASNVDQQASSRPDVPKAQPAGNPGNRQKVSPQALGKAIEAKPEVVKDNKPIPRNKQQILEFFALIAGDTSGETEYGWPDSAARVFARLFSGDYASGKDKSGKRTREAWDTLCEKSFKGTKPPK